MAGLSMQQNDDEWQLSLREQQVELNAAAAEALDCESGGVSLARLAEAGPMVRVGNDSVACGAWLGELVSNPEGTSLHRVSTSGGAQIEALVSGSCTRARLSQAPVAFRSLRHGMNNFLNNIQINAELARLLSSRGQDEKLQSAVERVIAECRTINDFLAEQLRPDALDADDWFAADTAVAALLGPPDSKASHISIAASTNLPAGVVHHLHGLVQAMRRAFDLGPAYALNILSNVEHPQLVLRLAGVADSAAWEDFLEQQWSTRCDNPASLANLSRHVTHFRAVAGDSGLELSAAVHSAE